jgi:hypothetical protein
MTDIERDMEILNKVMIPTQHIYLQRINELREWMDAMRVRIWFLENENLQLKRALEELSRQSPWDLVK